MGAGGGEEGVGGWGYEGVVIGGKGGWHAAVGCGRGFCWFRGGCWMGVSGLQWIFAHMKPTLDIIVDFSVVGFVTFLAPFLVSV